MGLGRRGGTRRWGCNIGEVGEESGMEVVPSRGRMVLRNLGNACVSRGLAGSALFSVDQDIDQDFLCLKIFIRIDMLQGRKIRYAPFRLLPVKINLNSISNFERILCNLRWEFEIEHEDEF